MTKFAHLISVRQKKSKKIMCVTFTNKAAKEMQKRAAQLMGVEPDELSASWINTFHSLSNRLLLD
jgi:DNA helicase-2/ATP-dependent DNA helicase PcrA